MVAKRLQQSVFALIVLSVLLIPFRHIAAEDHVAPHPNILSVVTETATIIESDLDTLQLLNTFVGVGDTFFIDLYVVNIDTLGAYAIRVIYDPAVIEPLTDTTVAMGDTLYKLELEQFRGEAFESFSGTVNSPGVLTMLAADFDFDTVKAFTPGSGVSARIAWRAQVAISTQISSVQFENYAPSPETFNAITDFHGLELYRPVLTHGAVQILSGPCDCSFQGDLDGSNALDAVDLNALIDILFFGDLDIEDSTCPRSRSDWNCDGVPDALDLNNMIDGLFFGGTPPCDPCN